MCFQVVSLLPVLTVMHQSIKHATLKDNSSEDTQLTFIKRERNEQVKEIVYRRTARKGAINTKIPRAKTISN